MSEKMKAAALSAATKGLSRVQAERAAENASRNVNAYGQKEEGPSRWQEKKEAKMQMYLNSTEKQPTLNQKRCQKCRQTGHWTYECQKPVPETPKLEAGLQVSHDLGGVFVKKAEKGLKKKEKRSKHRNRKRRNRSKSTSESSDSESDDDRKHRHRKRKHRSKSTSESSDSESDDDRRRKRKRHSRKSKGGR